MGTAPAYEVRPTFSMDLFGAPAFTILAPQSGGQANLIVPGQRYPENSSIGISNYLEPETKNVIPLAFTMDQLRSVQMGVPFNLSLNQVDAKVRNYENGSIVTNYDWALYKAQIDATSTNISLLANNNKKNYKFYARPEGATYLSRPEYTLGEAIQILFNGEVRTSTGSNGDTIYKYYIDNEEVTDDWVISFSPADQTEIERQLNQMSAKNLYDIILRPGMNVLIQKPDGSSVPIMQGAIYQPSDNSILARVFANGSPITSVIAKVKIDGVQKDVALTEDTSALSLYKAVLDGELDFTDETMTVVATAANGRTKEIPLTIPSNILELIAENGLKYEPYNQPNNEMTLQQIAQKFPDAEAFVVKAVHEGANRERKIKFGSGQTVSFGNADNYQEGDMPTIFYYEHSGYEGNVTYSSNDISFSPMWLSSFRKQPNLPGFGISLYRGSAYQGESIQFYENKESLPGSWNDGARSAQLKRVPVLRLYTEKYYKGDYKDVYANVDWIGDTWDNKVKSLRVLNDIRPMKITLYEHGSYTGDSRQINGRIEDLSTVDFHNKVSSIKFETYTNEYEKVPVYRFYEHTDYRGDYMDYIASSHNIGSTFNDKFSSVKVLNKSNNVKCFVYEHQWKQGEKMEITGDISNLRNTSMNDRITSLDIFNTLRDNTGTPIFRFYEHPNYQGRFVDYTSTQLDVANLKVGHSNWSVYNNNYQDTSVRNSFSSVRILNNNPTIRAIAYDGQYLNGRGLGITEDMPDLSPFDFGDKIESVRIVYANSNIPGGSSMPNLYAGPRFQSDGSKQSQELRPFSSIPVDYYGYRSLGPLNQEPGSGLLVFDNFNFEGNYKAVTGTDVVFGETPHRTSIRYVGNVPFELPKHSSNMIIKKSDLNSYDIVNATNFGNSDVKFYLQGYFIRNGGKSFKPFVGNQNTWTYQGDNQGALNSRDILTGVNDVDTYLVEVTMEKVAASRATVRLNQQTIELGNASTKALGSQAHAKSDPTHSELVFVKAYDASPDRLNVEVTFDDPHRWANNNQATYKFKILGTFSNSGNQQYNQLSNPIKRTFGTNFKGDNTTPEWYLDRNIFVKTPKGFLVNVVTEDASSSRLDLTINSSKISLGTSASRDNNGFSPVPVDHSGMVYVPVGQDPYAIDIKSSWASDMIWHGNYDIQIIGYFY